MLITNLALVFWLTVLDESETRVHRTRAPVPLLLPAYVAICTPEIYYYTLCLTTALNDRADLAFDFRKN